MKRRVFILSAAGLASCERRSAGQPLRLLRLGHFPNVTHVQALVAHQLSRQGKGWFEPRLGLPVQWFIYSGGPSATEAIFARALDATYIGPSPVLNAYARSQGKEMRVLAGAANGGVALIVRPDSGIHTPADFRGKRVATPQLGNTQDVQARAWLMEQGFRVTLTGGDVAVVPVQTADQLALLKRGGVDAVWTVEPWASKLEMEAGGKVFLEDRETTVTLLTGSANLVEHNRELALKLVAAHQELTVWIQQNGDEARTLVKAELKQLTRTEPNEELLNRSLDRTAVTAAISRASLERMVERAQKVGFLKKIPDLAQLLPDL